jgi:AraC-like DNA-binding protein
MILSGEAHAIRSKPDSPTQCLDFLREEQNVDTPPVFRLGQGPVTARIVCGRLRVTWPAGLRRMSMPPIIDMSFTKAAAGATAMRVETLHFFANGSGAAALLTRFAAMMLALALRSHPQCPLLFRLSASSDPIAHSLQLIGADPAANWSVASLAQKVGMSRSNFAARFAIEVNRTPMEVITERRMLFAAEMLEQGELKIVEVSARAGYRSEAAFSRRFTRYFGLSPSQVRRNSQRAGQQAGAASTNTAAAWHLHDTAQKPLPN